MRPRSSVRPRTAARPFAIALLLLLPILLLPACDPDPAGPGEIASVTVSPGAALVTAPGGTRTLEATALRPGGGAAAGVAFAWVTEDAAVATVSPVGVVTGVGAGSTWISATAGRATGRAEVHVRESASPAIVFHGGPVLTMDPVERVEEAAVVVGGRVFTTGPAAALLELAGPAATAVPLGGRAVMPGFVDPHNHIYNHVYHGGSPAFGFTYGEAQERLIRAGTTTMANGNIWPDALAHFLGFVDGGGLRVRTSVYLGINDVCGGAWPEDWHLAHPPVRDPEAMFRIPGIKLFTDGGACRRGAFSFYSDGGDLYLTATALADAVARVQAQGYQALIHSLGDIAADTVFRALETVLDGGPNPLRHRMDHNRYLRPHQLPRFAEVGAYPVVFGSPFTCRILDGASWSFLNNETYAAARPRFDPWRVLLDANPGHPVAWKSDAPIWTYEPLVHLWGLVTRDEQRPDGALCAAPDWLRAGAISVDEALSMMTIHAARVLHMDDAVGSLADGKLADLIVLTHDPRAVDPADIRHIGVLMTMVGGRVEYCADSAAVCPE